MAFFRFYFPIVLGRILFLAICFVFPLFFGFLDGQTQKLPEQTAYKNGVLQQVTGDVESSVGQRSLNGTHAPPCNVNDSTKVLAGTFWWLRLCFYLPHFCCDFLQG